MTSNRATTQFVRFVVVGLMSNLVLYLLYLAITGIGVGSKLAMTLLYIVGALQSFLFNQRWSFGHRGRVGPAFARYVGALGMGYAVNLTGLMLFVDLLAQPHQLVQGVMVLVVAVMLFIAQRYWVFPQASASDAA